MDAWDCVGEVAAGEDRCEPDERRCEGGNDAIIVISMQIRVK